MNTDFHSRDILAVMSSIEPSSAFFSSVAMVSIHFYSSYVPPTLHERGMLTRSCHVRAIGVWCLMNWLSVIHTSQKYTHIVKTTLPGLASPALRRHAPDFVPMHPADTEKLDLVQKAVSKTMGKNFDGVMR